MTVDGKQYFYERDGARILKRLIFNSPRSQRRHCFPARRRAERYPEFVALEIAKYDDGSGYYLFHITTEDENSDTYHSSMQEAMQQAEVEFGVTEEEWIDVAVA